MDAQIYVTKLANIDQKAGTYEIEGFFRMWWNDPRMAYGPDDPATTADDEECVGKLTLLDGKDRLWVPDFYFPPSVKHLIGAKNDGQQMDIYPSGDIYWSQRLRLTLNCKFDFALMPWVSEPLLLFASCSRLMYSRAFVSVGRISRTVESS